MAHLLHAADMETRTLSHGQWDRQRTDRAEISLWTLLSLAVQLLVVELSRTLLACLLVLLAMGPLAVHAAVPDEAAGRAVPERDSAALGLPAVGAGLSRGDWSAAAHGCCR